MEKQWVMFLLLACILKMWVSPTPSPPLGGNSTVGDCATPAPLSLHHKAVHQPQQERYLFTGDPSAQQARHLGWNAPWLEEVSALTALYAICWLPLTDVPWPHKCDGGRTFQGPEDPAASLLATTTAADVGSNILRLKKAQARGCYSWKSNPAIKQKHKWTRRVPEQQFKGEPQSDRYLEDNLRPWANRTASCVILNSQHPYHTST